LGFFSSQTDAKTGKSPKLVHFPVETNPFQIALQPVKNGGAVQYKLAAYAMQLMVK
jgi:hypothetical protein